MSTAAEIRNPAIVVDTAQKPLYERLAPAGAWLLAVFFLVTSIYISMHRMFWYDEIFTTLTARLSSLRTIWDALVHEPYDPTPFGYFVVVRNFDRLFGPGELGIRLPSALAVVAGMLLTYSSARRISDALHGLIALAALTCTLLPFYGYEGRSYGIYFFLSAAALWGWITERHPVFFFVLFFCGVTIHYYFVLCLVPFVAEEVYAWRGFRRSTMRTVAGILGGLAGLAAISPQIRATSHISGFWAVPTFDTLANAFSDFAPRSPFLFAIALLWIVVADRRKSPQIEAMSPAERTTWFFLLIPLVGFILALVVTHAFLSRYLIGILPGLSVGLASLLCRRFRGVPQISLGILLLLGGYGVFTQLRAVRHPDKIQTFGPVQERTRKILALEDQFTADGKQYIASDLLWFLQARYYSHHPERYVLVPESPLTHSRYYPFPSWTLEEATKHAHETAFLSPPDELLQSTGKAGMRPVWTLLEPFTVLYLE